MTIQQKAQLALRKKDIRLARQVFADLDQMAKWADQISKLANDMVNAAEDMGAKKIGLKYKKDLFSEIQDLVEMTSIASYYDPGKAKELLQDIQFDARKYNEEIMNTGWPGSNEVSKAAGALWQIIDKAIKKL